MYVCIRFFDRDGMSKKTEKAQARLENLIQVEIEILHYCHMIQMAEHGWEFIQTIAFFLGCMRASRKKRRKGPHGVYMHA